MTPTNSSTLAKDPTYDRRMARHPGLTAASRWRRRLAACPTAGPLAAATTGRRGVLK